MQLAVNDWQAAEGAAGGVRAEALACRSPAEASELLKNEGICINERAIPKAFLRDAAREAQAIVACMTDTLEKQGLEYKAQTAPWQFSNVASRSRGRIDIKLDPRDPAHCCFYNDALARNPFWFEVAKAACGDDVVLNFAGIVASFPGAEDQSWHRDGPHLFPEFPHLPPYAVVVFVPLGDISAASGPPEFICKTHGMSDDEVFQRHLPCTSLPSLAQGSAIVFDYRTVHRGVRNVGAENRPLLYYCYSRKFWKDDRNFGDVPLPTSSSRS
eukprot:g2070.t1